MILFQNDYVILDVDRTIYTNLEPDSPTFRELIFNFTIQCNGKLRRTVFTARVIETEKWEACSQTVNWLYLQQYQIVYNAFQLIADLWYDVPTGVEVHPLINKAIEMNFPM
jgi:hypothetical protein